MEYIIIIIAAILVNNVVLSQFLGICPFVGVSKKVETAIGMSMAVLFVITLSSTVTWLIYTYVLAKYHIEFLQTLTFILVIASLVQIVEIVLKKVAPPLYQALGIFLPLITTNCAVLGVALLTLQKNYNLTQSVVFAAATAIGFGFALIIFAGIREQLALSTVPKALKDTPIALISAGLLAMAFMGFSGLV